MCRPACPLSAPSFDRLAAVDDARYAPALAVADRARHRIVGEHVGHRTQGCAVVGGVEPA